MRVVITDYASQRDALEYVRSHWKVVQHLLDAQRGGKKKRLIRPIKDRALQEEVVKLSQLSGKELRARAEEVNPRRSYKYKESAIREILIPKYGRGLTESSIRKTITRWRKITGH